MVAVVPVLGARLISRVMVLSTVLGLGGCILLVSPSTYGEHCRFENERSACGACMASKCAGAVDACCRDGACDLTLALLELCAGGDPSKCTSLASDLSAAAPSRSALASCFIDQCEATCRNATPTSNITQCSVPAFGRGQTCKCIVSNTPNDTVCNETAFPITVCCAPMGWPAPGLGCSCRAVDCGPTADGCLCGLQEGPSGGTQCSGTICCLDQDTCECGSRACLLQDQMVTSCTFASIGCAVGQQHVTSCA
ncbi:MAG: hypothetical protein QOI41_4586, partial [Myxococcales bacterium]|nr:hypothetical protein [Myxococcales bacterium]